MGRKSGAVVLLFAKAPIPGQVKTRMQPVLSPDQAAALYERMVAHIVSAVVGELPVVVYRHGPAEHQFWSDLAALGVDDFVEQRGADLGDRMANAVAEQLDLGYSAVILIGGDCPAVDRGYIDLAHKALLQGADAVIGPARDGGYVLLGIKQRRPELFNNMPWGSDRVFELSLQRCRQMGLAVDLLPQQTDIDRPEDLPALPTELAWPGL